MRGVDPVDAVQATQHRVGLVVDSDPGSGTEMLGKRRRELVHPVVEIREEWAVQVIVGKVGRHPIDEESVEVRRRVSLYDNRHRPEQRCAVTVLGGHGGAGGVGDRTGTEQHQPVDTLSLKLILNPAKAVPTHASEIRQTWDRQSADRHFC